MSLAKGILDHAPSNSWWTEAKTQDEFYTRARQEYRDRLWKQRGSVQSFEMPHLGGRITRPTRRETAE